MARPGARRPWIVVGVVAGFLAGSCWGLASSASSGGLPPRVVHREVAEAALVPDIQCVHRTWDGNAYDPPRPVAGAAPAGFVPATVTWCREDGRVHTTPWTPQWAAQLTQPDLVWALAPLLEGPCPMVAHETTGPAGRQP